MRTISELQMEIRKVRSELTKLDNRIEGIDQDLEELKDTGTASEYDFEKVYRIAKINPLFQHPIKNSGTSILNVYLPVLILLGGYEGKLNMDQLVFLQRILLASGSDKKLSEFIIDLGRLDPEVLFSVINDEMRDKYATSLLLDCFIVSRISDFCSEQMLQLMAGICDILGCSSEGVRNVSKVAKVILEQNYKGMSLNSGIVMHLHNLYGHYLSEIPGWKDEYMAAYAADRKRKKESENWYYYAEY